MASPFPGMDPYLEDPRLWPDVHNSLITFLKATLNALLPPQYVAHVDERLYILEVESDPPFVILEEPAHVREAFINLVRKGDPGRVVATMEVLSPTNKDPGSPGRDLYIKKQQETLESSTHLVEIDLLRQGQHTVAASEQLLDERGHWDYVACLHRASEGRCFATWPVTMRQRLPRIQVPLANGDKDIVLDLQAVFKRCYDECGYIRDLDYTQEPTVPLPSDDAEWAGTLLRARGLRKRKRRAK